MAIEDLAALGRRRHGAHLLAFGASGKLIVLNHLQHEQPRLDARHAHHEHAGGRQEAALQHRAPVGIGLNGHG